MLSVDLGEAKRRPNGVSKFLGGGQRISRAILVELFQDGLVFLLVKFRFECIEYELITEQVRGADLLENFGHSELDQGESLSGDLFTVGIGIAEDVAMDGLEFVDLFGIGERLPGKSVQDGGRRLFIERWMFQHFQGILSNEFKTLTAQNAIIRLDGVLVKPPQILVRNLIL